MNHRNQYHNNVDEPPSTSFLASTDGGGGYRYAAYEDDYLYDNNNIHHHRNSNNGMTMGGMAPGQGDEGPMNDYGYGDMDMNLAVDDNLSSSAASSHTPSSTSSSSEYSIDFDNPAIANLPRILLMGPRRGGKTSIQRVVFQKMSPHETLFRLEATQNLERAVVDHTPLCRFTIWDFPGDYYGQQHSYYQPHPSQYNQYSNHPQHQLHQSSNMYGQHHSYNAMNQPGMIPDSINPMNPSNNNNVNNSSNPDSDPQQNQPSSSDAHIYTHATALIFVIDAQDEPYDHVLQSFTETVTRAISANPHVAIEVFINKVDGELFLSDEAKYECRRDIMQQVSEELADAGINEEDVPISYHLTSIYDHSVFEAVSRVVQKLIPQLPTLENLLNVLVSTCSMEKAYLFDVASKLYISTDSSPVDIQSVELCSDMIDVVLDVSGIYGIRQHNPNAVAQTKKAKKSMESQQAQSTSHTNDTETNTAGTGTGTAMENGSGNMIGTGVEVISTHTNHLGEEISTQGDQHNDQSSNEEQEKDGTGVVSDSAYDSESSSVIRLSNGMILYLKEVDTMLALVCITRAENFRKKSLINYNISCLKKALRMLVQQPQSYTTALEESQQY